MKFTSRSQSIVELSSITTHSNPGPIRTIPQEFDRHSDAIQGLPLLEKIKIVLAADFIAESFTPGNLPIMSVQLVGHADKDYQRGEAFERKISEDRARQVEKALRETVNARLFWGPLLVPTQFHHSKIQWTSRGEGSRIPFTDGRQKRSGSVSPEKARLLNRRVEIFLEPADNSVPQPTPKAQPSVQDILRMTEEAIRKFFRDHPPQPQPHFPPTPPPLPPRKSPGWQEILDNLSKFTIGDFKVGIDMKLLGETLKEAAEALKRGGPPMPEEAKEKLGELLHEFEEELRKNPPPRPPIDDK